MTALGLLLSLVVILVAGAAIARLLGGQEHPFYRAELTALSWLLGTGYVTLAWWGLGAFLSGWWLVAAVGAGGLFLAGLAFRRGWPRVCVVRDSSDKLGLPDWLLIGLLVGQAAFIAYWAPRIALGWDGLMIWELKARLAFENGGVLPGSYFADVDRAWSHPDYPLAFPYLETWFYRCLGHVDQAWVRLLGPLYYFAGAALVATGTRRLGGSRRVGLAAAAALFFVPYLFGGLWGVLSGYADFPLGVVFLGALLHLPGLRESKAGDDRLFAVLAALLVWGKREGRFLWLALILLAAVALLPRRRWRTLLMIAAPGAVLLVGFEAFLAAMHTVKDPTYLPVTLGNLQANADRLGTIVERIGAELIKLESWGLLWIGFAFALVALTVRGRRALAARFACALLLPLAAYALPFMLTTWGDFRVHMALALPRLLLHLAPAAMLAIALAWPPRPAPAMGGDAKQDPQP